MGKQFLCLVARKIWDRKVKVFSLVRFINYLRELICHAL
jgi:hypothetical protein